jgi:hypothetical protein
MKTPQPAQSIDLWSKDDSRADLRKLSQKNVRRPAGRENLP